MRTFLLTTFILINNIIGFSQETISVGTRTHRLIEFFETYHLKPKSFDDQFKSDFESILLTNIDGWKSMLTKTDVEELSSIIQKMDNSVESIDSVFEQTRLTITTRIEKNNQLISEVIHELEKSDDIQTVPVSVDVYALNEEELKQKWRSKYISQVHHYLFDQIDDIQDVNLETLLQETDDAKEYAQKRLNRYLKSFKSFDKYYESLFINTVAKTYDPHSDYFSPSIKEEFEEELESNPSIFGISYGVEDNGKIKITALAPGSSAWFSGKIHVGDEILSIESTNGEVFNAEGATINDLGEYFNLKATDTINIEVQRDKEVSKARLVRSKVYSDTDIIKSALLLGEKNIGYVSLPDFYTNWTDTTVLGCANDVAKAILKLEKNGIDGLILDLRDNGGGSIDEAIDLVGIFINFGPVIVEEDNSGELFTYKDFNRGSIFRKPLIVLVNEFSASASEIVAGSLQDYNRALIVGHQTFGKATGQQIRSLDPKKDNPMGYYIEENPNWGYVKTTLIGLYLPTKYSAQGKGITPDIMLPTISPYVAEYESDYPNYIKLDSINKKLYFQPKSPAKIAALKDSYETSSSLIDLESISKEMTIAYEKYNAANDLKTKLSILQDIDTLVNRYDGILESTESSFKPQSIQFSESMLQLAPYLQDYDADFIDDLNTDIELNEAFNIMLEFINLAK